MIRIFLAFLAGCAAMAGGLKISDTLSTAPPSEFISEEADRASLKVGEDMAPHIVDILTGDIDTQRHVLDTYLYGPRIDEARQLYPIKETGREIAGVYTEEFEPRSGVAPEYANKVLINLHGGGFSLGARSESKLESIPLSHFARMRVISVDYRQGPEHRFPAASEDVAAVYRELLKEYRPQDIAIFGCSAGGLLTAQAVAWFDAHDLPQPGAVGIFCAGAGRFFVGDALLTTPLLSKVPSSGQGGESEMVYFEDANWDDPLVAPLHHPAVLAEFPPTLVITSTRDMAMSSALVTHQRLLSAGVSSQLHVYEGLEHYWYMDTGLPESVHAFEVMAKFFQDNLGS